MKSNELRDTIVAIADSKNEAYQMGQLDAINEALANIKKMYETCKNNDHDCDKCEYTKHSYHETCVEYVLRCMKLKAGEQK